MAKELFNSNEAEQEKAKEIELVDKVVIADNYKDQRNEPYGVIIIALLSLVLGGTLTGFFVLFNAFKNVPIVILDIVIWVLILALIVYSLFYYIINKKNPKEAIIYDPKTGDFSFYIQKNKEYITYNKGKIKSIRYKAYTFYPKINLVGPIPKKPVGDKVIIELTDNKIIKVFVLDVFKARKKFSEIDFTKKDK